MDRIIRLAGFIYFFTHSVPAISSNFDTDKPLTASVKIIKSNNPFLSQSDGEGTTLDMDGYVLDETGNGCYSSVSYTNDFVSEYTHYNVIKGCIVFYWELHCSGDFAIKHSNSDAHLRIKNRNFGNRIGSVSRCEEKCNETNTTNTVSTNLTSLVTLRSELTGQNVSLDVKGCVLIPRVNQWGDSVQIHDNVCIELHENWNCTGRTRSFSYPGSNDIDDLIEEKSISSCAYNCIIRPKIEGKKIPYPGPGIVTLFDEPNFEGNYQHVNITQGCEEVFYHYTSLGRWKSIRTYGQCVTIHKEPSCLEATTETFTSRLLLLNGSNPDVHTDFKLELSSVKLCHQTASIMTLAKIQGERKEELFAITNCISSPRVDEELALVRYTTIYAGCMKIYKNRGCKGKYLEEKQGDKGYTGPIYWDRKNEQRQMQGVVGSIGPCKWDTQTMEIRDRNTSDSITLYTLENQKGQSVTIVGSGCKIVPRELQRRVKSVQTDNCIELFEHWNCTGRSFEYDRNRYVRTDTIPTPMSYEMYWKDRISSVRLCASARDIHPVVRPRNASSPGSNFVSVFDEFGFNGNLLHLDLTNGCTKIGDDFPGWEGETKSIWTYKKCVVVYNTVGCTRYRGSQHLQLNEYNILHHSNLSFPVRSIKQCHQADKPLVITFVNWNDQLLEGCISNFPVTVYNELINGDGNCLNIYEARNCIGKYIRITEGDSGFRWAKDGYRGEAGSVSQCECDPRSKESRYFTNHSTLVTLYDSFNHQGRKVRMNVKGCQAIPRLLRRSVRSIQFDESTEGQCVELHEHWNCTGRSVQRGNSSRQQVLLVGIRYNKYADLGATVLLNWKDPFSSISNCGYCATDVIRELPSVAVGSNVVRIFDETHFNGNHKELNFNRSCLNIGEEWEGEFKSIQLFNNCVILYSSLGCLKSTDFKTLNYSNTKDQADYPMTWPVKSIKSCKEHELQKSQLADSRVSILPIVLPICAIFFIALIVAAGVIIRLKQKVREVLSDREIGEFVTGDESQGKEECDVLGQNRPYDQSYEIPKELLDIDLGSPLGSGAFAVVYKGSLRRSQESEELVVAVKTLRRYCGLEYTRALLKEIKTMIYVGDQERIVKIIGCCTKILKKGELYVMTELCQNGSMEQFLRNNKEGFVDVIGNGETDLNNLQMKVLQSTRQMEPISPSNFNTIHLMKWSLQIAEGMEYLATKKVVHGDLATRNVLLDDNFGAKISDFGLSRQLYQYSQYVKKTKSPLPWRWLAIETLTSFTFSTESDVWAFGVTLWEIFSLGRIPFPQKTWNDDFISDLTDGLRLKKPKYASTDWFTIMIECWREMPSVRITFPSLRSRFTEIFHKYLPPPNDEIYLDLTLGPDSVSQGHERVNNSDL